MKFEVKFCNGESIITMENKIRCHCRKAWELHPSRKGILCICGDKIKYKAISVLKNILRSA